MGISSSQGGKVRRGRAIGVKDRDLSNPRPAPSLRFLSAVEDPAQKKKKSSTSELRRQELSFSFNLQHHPPLLLTDSWRHGAPMRAHTHRDTHGLQALIKMENTFVCVKNDSRHLPSDIGGTGGPQANLYTVFLWYVLEICGGLWMGRTGWLE